MNRLLKRSLVVFISKEIDRIKNAQLNLELIFHRLKHCRFCVSEIKQNGAAGPETWHFLPLFLAGS
jgi:hypothetical protein